MKHLVILGAGTAGTMMANRLQRQLPAHWDLTVIDPEGGHLYQPGLLFLPFGADNEASLTRPRKSTLDRDIDWRQTAVAAVEPDAQRVVLEDGPDGKTTALPYDLLIVATGSQIRPEETPGLLGEHWGNDVSDFYTLQGALTLRDRLEHFEGGRLVVNVVEMPIKCPVAPLEFLFLADAFFSKKGIRDRVELIYATPLDGAFTRPVASRMLGSLLEQKGIRVESEFNTGEVDGDAHVLRSWDEREIGYDLLVSIPTHMGAPVIEASGLGNELGFVPTDPHTLQAKDHPNIFVLGDATDLASSKAGSVAHFQAEGLQDNVLRAIQGRSLEPVFDGHANCFIESGHGKALLIDFNYDVEPLPGRFPWPVVGPMSLLRESRLNHLGKLAFAWVYWNALLPGHDLPVSAHMSMAGKHRPPELATAA